MKRIKKNFVKLIEINKSKFYGILFPVDNVEEVKEYLNQVRKDYPKATSRLIIRQKPNVKLIKP